MRSDLPSWTIMSDSLSTICFGIATVLPSAMEPRT